MRPLLTLLLLCLTALPLRAETAFDVTLMTEGQTVRWRAENGNTAVTYLGPEGGLYRFAFTRDGSKGDPAKVAVWSNRRGEAVRAEVGGLTVRYKPSDCTLTVGRCTYTEALSDGARRKMVHLASVANDVWTYRLYHTAEAAENLIEEGTFTVDAAAVILDRTYRIREGGVWRDAWSKRR
ncbi:hypothetical protein OU426_13240 [Frigidibacter sp. RF13]|uniref:hypothetical protein n=1 Tax=Frigidibacter sp. RF13 TaxID=2997340 RepID=UPI00226D5F15|nr:hypothetical protein [Frigidibacter sp. RF13]MCY1127822.1 hypothetical protein [Frigidibacter sp. RF13]